jgi:hypothetical protein
MPHTLVVKIRGGNEASFSSSSSSSSTTDPAAAAAAASGGGGGGGGGGGEAEPALVDTHTGDGDDDALFITLRTDADLAAAFAAAERAGQMVQVGGWVGE